jgi:hypothetical protein
LKSRVIVSCGVFVAFVLGLITFHPIARAVELAISACQSSSACSGGKNSGGGPGLVGSAVKGNGVQASSTSGNGVIAQTSFASKSTSSFKSGLVGQDLSTSGKFDLGVWGTSKRGDGILGQSTSGAGVVGASSSNAGVTGTSSSNTGVYGQVNGGKAPNGVFGQDNSTSANGVGVVGQSKVGTGVIASTTQSSSSGQALLASAPNGNSFIFVGVGSGNNEVAFIDNQGNLFLAGQVTTSSGCEGCSRTRRVRTYGASAASPTLEDTGEAQLTAGGAYVHLDPAFANVIDPRQGYLVLITPEGDTHGVYVAQRTISGFAVRENFGGHSNAAFAYRIVAHPLGVNARRLPFIDARPISASRQQPATTQPAADAQP